MPEQRKSFTGVEELHLVAACNVTVSKGSEFTVLVTGTDADKVKVGLSDGVVHISASESISGGMTVSGSTMSFNSVNFSSGGMIVNGGGNVNIFSNGRNVVIQNGVVYIDGKRVDEGSSGDRPAYVPVTIEITAPDGLRLDCQLTGCASFSAQSVFSKARVSASGSSVCEQIHSKSAVLRASGSASISHQCRAGNLNASASGSGRITSTGTFADVTVSTSGAANISTEGSVLEDFEADASGASSIHHQGKVSGRRSRSTSGCGRVSWS